MIILDTNVLSALMQAVPERKVVGWVDRQPQGSIWTTAITVLEIQAGLRLIPMEAERAQASEKFERLLDSLFHRIAVFGEEAPARHCCRRRRTRGTFGTFFSDIAARVVNPWVA